MGSGNCLFWAPETFDLGEAGHAVLLDPRRHCRSERGEVRIAAQGCPVGAISLWRDGAEQSLEEKA